MKKLLLFVFIFVSTIVFNQAKATHVMGSDITYKCLGNGKYEVTVTVYRDCNGVSLSNSPLNVKCNSGSTSFSLPKTSVKDITGIDSRCPTQSRCSGSFQYGIEEHIFSGIIDLSALNCCEVTLSWTQCCRNSNITTGAANENFYTEAVLDKCINPCNSSPVFTSKPAALVCVGQDFAFNNGALDTIDVGDSLSYKLVDPLSNPGVKINYSGSWSAQKPISFLGFPNASLGFPAGFQFDETTGDLSFRPTVVNQVTVLVLEVTEWRKINGVMTKVGITRRDMQVIVVNCPNNKVPKIKGQSAIACSGQQVCIDVESSDDDAKDTVRISWNRGIPKATFTHNNGSVKKASGSVCWTPTKNDVSNVPYSFTITAKDDGCDIAGQAIRSFSITVRESPEATIIANKLICGKVAIDYTPLKNNYPGLTHEWLVKDSIGRNIAFSGKKQDTLRFQPGKNRLFLTLKTSTPCVNAFVDTIDIDPFVQVDLPTDTLICDGNPMTFDAITTYGKPAYHYTWSTGDTTQKTVVNPGVDSSFWVSVKDGEGCDNSDTVKVKWSPLPPINIGPDVRICYDQLHSLDGGNDSIPYTFLWSTNDTSRYIDIKDSGLYVLQLTDSLGCSNYDSMNLFVNTVPVDAGPNQSICDKDTVKMTATGADSYQWYIVPNLASPVSTFNTHSFVVTGDREVHVKATRTYMGITCTNTDTVQVRKNELPTISFSSISARCVNDPRFGLSIEGLAWPTLNTGTWTGVDKPNIVSGNFFYPDSAGANPPPAPSPTGHRVRYTVIDNKGCKNSDITTVPVNPLPAANASDGSYCGYDGKIDLGKHITVTPGLLGTITWTSDNPQVQAAIQKQGFAGYTLDVNQLPQNNTYQAISKVSNSSTGCTNYDTANITVRQIPVVDAGALPPLCQNGVPVDLNLVSGANPTGGTWSQKIGGMGLVGTEINPALFPAYTGGTSYVYYTYDIPGNNCPVNDSFQFTIKPIPNTQIAAIPKVCEDAGFNSISAYGSPSGGVWSSTAATVSAGGQVDITATGFGTFPVNYSVTLNGCKVDAASSFEIQQTPSLTVVVPPAACEGEPFNLSATYTAATGVQWSTTGDGTFDNTVANTPVYTPGAQDNATQGFDITVFTTNTIADDVCAPATRSFNVEIHPIPTADIIGNPLEGCEPHVVDFTALTDQAADADYLWNFGDAASSSNTGTKGKESHEYNQQGLYTVTLKVTNNKTSCFKNALPVQVTVHPTPDADFKMSREVTTVAATDVVFTNLTRIDLPGVVKNLDYTWEYGDISGKTSKDFSPTYEYPTDTGLYIVTLTAVTDKGCRSVHTDTLLIGPDITVFIPNAFTPDPYGPEKNNYFHVTAEGFESFEMFIFSRWGEKVHYSNNIEQGWDGKFKGEPAQQDVYTYVVNVTSFSGKPYTFSGTVTLLR